MADSDIQARQSYLDRIGRVRAADDLAHSSRSLAAIAARAGYTSQSSFTRALTAAHGMAPATFRQAGMHASLQQAIREDNAMAFNVDIRRLQARPAVGLLHKGAFTEIGETFERLFSLLGAYGLMQHVRGPFGRYRDGPDGVPLEDLRLHACAFTDVPVTPPAPLEAFMAGGGTYAVQTYTGPYAGIKPAYDWLFGVWLPGSGREPRDDHVLEINLNTPIDTAPADLLTEICLPLED